MSQFNRGLFVGLCITSIAQDIVFLLGMEPSTSGLWVDPVITGPIATIFLAYLLSRKPEGIP
jgi:hypothetical protein